VVGGVLAFWANFRSPFLTPIVGAVVGFTVAATHLRLKYAALKGAKAPSALPPHSED
jgi:hypothetical protein